MAGAVWPLLQSVVQRACAAAAANAQYGFRQWQQQQQQCVEGGIAEALKLHSPLDSLTKVVAKPCPWWRGPATVHDSLAGTIYAAVCKEHIVAALSAEGFLDANSLGPLSAAAVRAPLACGMPVPADVSAGIPILQELRQDAASVMELGMIGQALGSLAISMACNNPGCSNSSGPSELKLVKGSSKTCSGCQTARFCCKECQGQHWKQHKAACERLKAARMAQPG